MSDWNVRGLPSWMSQSDKGSKLRLLGNRRGWVGQPVVSRVKIKAKGRGDGDANKLFVDRAMAASWTYKGNADKDNIIFGGQAGAITKRANSVIDFGRDNVRDVFSFANTTREHGPFNHMQRYVIKNFGRKDIVRLQNIGKTFGFRDLRSFGGGVYGFNGVPIEKLKISLASDLG